MLLRPLIYHHLSNLDHMLTAYTWKMLNLFDADRLKTYVVILLN